MLHVNKNARTSSSLGNGVSGFTLIELLLSTMLGAFVVGVVAFTFANVAGSFAEEPTGQSLAWDASRSVSYSPAYSQLPFAFNLQAEISDCLQASLNAGSLEVRNGSSSPVTAIFVLSSADGNLPSAEVGVADIATLAGVASASLTSSADFRALVSASLTEAEEGFSIFFISGENHVTLAVHCRSEALAGGGTLYTVRTYQGAAFCPELSYAFGVKNSNSSVNPGVRIIKLRSDTGWGIDEDVATQVVLPDPSMVAYQIEAGDSSDVRTYSRFAMLLPVKP